MNRGEFVTFMLVPDMVKLISEQLKVFTSAIRWLIPTCHIMRSFLFTNTLIQTDSELFSSSVMGMCWISLWTSNITPPPWRFLSCKHCMGKFPEIILKLQYSCQFLFLEWPQHEVTSWWKSRKANSSSFFASNAIDIHANRIQDIYFEFSAHIGAHTVACNGFTKQNKIKERDPKWQSINKRNNFKNLTNFSPLTKLFLFVPFEEDLVFFSFVKGSNLFWFSKFNWSSKKESEKLKKSHFGQIQVQFEFCTVSYRVSVM